MKKYGLLTLFGLFLSIPVLGQWITLNSGTASDLLAIDFANMDFGVAVGERGTILHTMDGGDNWTNLSAPDQTETLRSVLIVDLHNILTAGNSLFEGIVRRTTDIFGLSWDPVTVGADLALTGTELLALSYQALHASRDQGITWERKALNLGSTLLMDRFRFADVDHGYIIGNVSGFASYSTYGFRTADSGQSWGPLYVFDLPNANAYTSFSTPAPDTAYLFSNKQINYSPGPENTLVRMTGFYFDTEQERNAWRFQAEEVNSNMPGYIICSAFVDGWNGYAGSIDGTIYVTNNGGVDWKAEYSGRDTIFQIEIMDDGFIYAVGSNGLILRRPVASPTLALERPATIEVFPNPTEDKLNVQGLPVEKALGRLTASNGQLIRAFHWRRGDQIDVSGLEAGWYLLELWSGPVRYLAKFQKLP